ncbi:Uncharacterised protein [Citrobacter youngae]|uniref:Uncharacterized protein n=1 Tax=Citrobacter youngae TaxID=133448 RepID=A0ABN7GM12_9ENTR|nr:Uncharacterised protein [Citrobacter youngae]
MLGIILRKTLNMLNPEKVVPEVGFALRNRQSPRQDNGNTADNRQQAVNKDLFPALLHENPWQHAEDRDSEREKAFGHHAHAAGKS